MAHCIDVSTGEAAVFTGSGVSPWHELGITIPGLATADEAMRLAHLGWKAIMRPAGANTLAGFVPAEGYQAVIRSDTNRVLSIVGSRYTPFQNSDMFEFLDSLVSAKLAMYDSAGALHNGQRVWALAKLPQEYRIGREDVIKPYALVTNTHDGTSCIRFLPTTVRVMCQNTLTLALRGQAEGVAIRHCHSMPDKVEEARKKMGLVSAAIDKHHEVAVALAARNLNGGEARGYFEQLFPVKLPDVSKTTGTDGAALLSTILDGHQHTEAIVADLLEGARAQTEAEAHRNRELVQRMLGDFELPKNNLPGEEHSGWSAYCAVNDWVDHERNSRGKGVATRLQNRMESVLFKSGATMKREALQVAQERFLG